MRLRGRVVARRAFFALRATHFCAPASRCPPIPLRAESFLSWPQPFLSIACRVWSIAQLLIVTPCHSPTDLALPLRCATRLFPSLAFPVTSMPFPLDLFRSHPCHGISSPLCSTPWLISALPSYPKPLPTVPLKATPWRFESWPYPGEAVLIKSTAALLTSFCANPLRL